MCKLRVIAVIIFCIAVPFTGCAHSRSLPTTDEAAIRETLDAFFDALRAGDYEEATTYLAGVDEMSDDDREETGHTLVWMRLTSSGLTGATFENITIMEFTAKASHTKTTTNEKDSLSFSYSVELDLKKEDGEWRIDLS